ncbi:MAG: hypothetical protein LBD20_08500 [Spirochaetaceae bacterium]|jgi:hypothetical protein|nr:hypothetical protein [Spirochaetaceae bacterium]
MSKKYILNNVNFFSPPLLIFLYTLAALIIMLIFRSFVPQGLDGLLHPAAQDDILPIYRRQVSLCGALLDWIRFFPALVMAALVMPYGLKPDYEPPEGRFSIVFLNKQKPAIMSAVAASAIMAILTLLVRPVLHNRLADIKTNSTVYRVSKENAEAYANNEDWAMALGFLALCQKIWPEKNPGLRPLEERIRIGQERLLYGRAKGAAAGAGGRGIPGEKQPVNAQEAIAFAKKALEEGRFYDAHWLANLAVRIARPGSVEAANGASAAAEAWNRISIMERSNEEMTLNSLYLQKRAGYEAMLSEDWIRAYYIFHDLSLAAPDDPDVIKYYAMCTEGIQQVAFFIDEINSIAGAEIENVVFSIPRLLDGGTMVLRTGYLSTLTGASYASRLYGAAYGPDGEPLFAVETPFAKFEPIFINGAWKTAVLLRAIDRGNSAVHWLPLWTGGENKIDGASQLLLDITYEDFLLAASGRRTIETYYLANFSAAASRLAPYGYVQEIFQTEIIRIISEPLMFLPLAIFSIIVGIRYRSRNRPRFSAIPMMIILPLVFDAVFLLILGTLEKFYTMAVIAAGMTAAAVCAISLIVLLIIASFLTLAAQHG